MPLNEAAILECADCLAIQRGIPHADFVEEAIVHHALARTESAEIHRTRLIRPVVRAIQNANLIFLRERRNCLSHPGGLAVDVKLHARRKLVGPARIIRLGRSD